MTAHERIDKDGNRYLCCTDRPIPSSEGSPDLCHGCECHGGTEVASCIHCVQLRSSEGSGPTLRDALEGLLPFVRVGDGPLGEDPAAKAMRVAYRALDAPAAPPVLPSVEVLRKIAGLQQKALGYIERYGFIFDRLGPLTDDSSELDRWKVLAFSLYTDLASASINAEDELARLVSTSDGTDDNPHSG